MDIINTKNPMRADMVRSIALRYSEDGILSMCEQCSCECKHVIPGGNDWAVYCRTIDMTEYRRHDIQGKFKGQGDM